MEAYIVKKQGDIASLEWKEVEMPVVRRDEVLVKVLGSSINPADVKVILGGEGAKFIHSARTPIRPGFDFSGVVEQVGSNVSSFKPNEEVFGFLPYSAKTIQGSYGEYVAIKANEIAIKPTKLNHAQAGAVPTVASTAWQSLVDIAKVRKDQKVLINGASGGVGSFAVQIARLYEAKVWATASQENLEFIKDLGVDHAFDYKTDWKSEVDQRFDIVFDVASNLMHKNYKKLLTSRGTYVTLLPGVDFVKSLLLNLFSGKQIKMCMVKGKTETLAKITDHIENDRLKVPVAKLYKLKDLKQALTNFKQEGAQGKIVIEK